MAADGSGGRERARLPAGGGVWRIVRCGASRDVVLWARDTLLLFEEGNIKEKPVSLLTDFMVQQVLLSSNCAGCVDGNGNVHTVSLKFKSKVDKLSVPFKPRAQGLLACVQAGEDTAAAISRARPEELQLCIHRVNADFKLVRKYKIEINFESFQEDHQDKVILGAFRENIDKVVVEKIFKVDTQNFDGSILVLFSLDRLTLFGQIVNEKDCKSSVTPEKLFTCPTEISALQIVKRNGLNLLMALKSGTVVILCCKMEKIEAKIIHLNAAIHQLIPINNDALIYSDGIKMWKAENIFSDNELTFKEIFVKQPKDFLKYDDRILCTTYTNMLYSFCTESDEIFVNLTTANKGFMSVPRDLTNSKNIVTEIMNEVKRNEQILLKIKLENTLTTAVALSKESAVLDRHISFTVHIHDQYEDVLKEHGRVTLTRSLKQYFERNSVLLMIKMQTSSEFRQKFNEICTSLAGNIHLHVAVLNGNHFETTTIPLNNKLEDGSSCLLPVQPRENSRVVLTLKIISPISGPVDATQTYWTILYSKNVTLYSEHFIKADGESFTSQVNYIEDYEKDVDDMVMDFAKIKHGLLYDFQVPQKKSYFKEWSFYVKLPKDYQQKLSNIDSYSKTLNYKLSRFLVKKLSSEFLKGKQTVYLTICGSKVGLQIIFEDENNILKMSGLKADLLHDLKCFFSCIFYKFCEYPELIPQIQYTRVENLRRKLRDLQHGSADATTVLSIAEQFHRYTLGALPL